MGIYYVHLKNFGKDCLVLGVDRAVVVGPPAVAAGRLAEVGVHVAARRERDAVLVRAAAVRAGERRDGVRGVEVVVEERLALGGLRHRLLADERLGVHLRRGERRLRLGELRLERDDLRRLGVRLRGGGDEVHRARHGRDRARAAQLLHAARRRRRLRRGERREGVLGQQPHAARRRRVRRLERRLRLRPAGRGRLRLAAPRVARLELRAVLRRVPDLVAVAALVLEQLRAAHLALRARRVLDEVARELRLAQPLGFAVGAELGVALGSGLGSGRHVRSLEGVFERVLKEFVCLCLCGCLLLRSVSEKTRSIYFNIAPFPTKFGSLECAVTKIDSVFSKKNTYKKPYQK